MIRTAFIIIYLNVLFPILNIFSKKDTYLFFSFMGLKPAGDSLSFYYYVKKRNPKAKCVWIYKKGCKDNFNFNDENTKYVEVKSRKLLFAYLKAKVAVSNGFFPYLYWKNKGSYYIETWHGSPFKYDLLDSMSGKISIIFMKKYIKNTDLLVLSDSLLEEHCCNSAAMNYYSGNVLRCGPIRKYLLLLDYSKNDEYLSVKQKVGDKKIILYCPTYRDYSEDAFENNTNDLIEKFQKSSLVDEYALCIRLHHLSKFKIKEDDNVIDLTNIANSEMVVSMCDLCVSDYSSIIYDAISIDKKVVLLQFDLEEYISKRNLYFKNAESELGIQTVYNNDDLMELITNGLNNIKEDYNFETYGSDNPCESLYEHLIKNNIL